MTRSSIIIGGITLAVLLIFLTIAVNATKFYNELESVPSSNLEVKPSIVLHDRTS